MSTSELSRRSALGLLSFAVIAPTLASCSTGSASSGGEGGNEAEDSFPVTIKHVFGETTIEKAPQRPATLGWGSEDTVLQLGVVPVAMPSQSWGQNQNNIYDWTEKLLEDNDAAIGSDKAPVLYADLQELPLDELAKASPDVILALQSGITEEQYAQLSKIAPTVVYPEKPWSTSWQESVTTIGQALGRSAKAEELVEQTEELIAKQQEEYPDIKGKTFISAAITTAPEVKLWMYTPMDTRSRLLQELGLELAEIVKREDKAGNLFAEPWSLERANELEADVVVNWTSMEDNTQAIKSDSLLSQIPAISKGGLVNIPDAAINAAMTMPSPAGIAWGMDKFMPVLAKAAKGEGA